VVEVSDHLEESVKKDAEPENDQDGDLPEEAMQHVPEEGVPFSVEDSGVKDDHVHGSETQKWHSD
jgi:hypothetical protein